VTSAAAEDLRDTPCKACGPKDLSRPRSAVLSYLTMDPRMGSLNVVPALDRPDLLATPVAAALAEWKNPVPVTEIGVAEIDPELADTAAFCERYEVAPGESANCVVLVGRRGGETKLAACVVLATTRADVNGVARRQLDARKASFAPVEAAVAATGMEYGGITPVGLPEGWPILIDAAVAAGPRVVVGSGVRRSKLALPGAALAALPGAVVISGLGLPSDSR
jgi:prolyl-tRNA editing enzyme YbaK/EbsC (Cys-tRNA(Pro) deacylase)